MRRWFKSKNFWLHLSVISALLFPLGMFRHEEYGYSDLNVVITLVSIVLTPSSLGMFVLRKWGFTAALQSIKEWSRSKNFWLHISTIPTLLPIIVFIERAQGWRSDRDLGIYIPFISLIGFCLIMNAIRKNPSD